MRLEKFSETLEKHGFLTGDPHLCKTGVSKKSRKPYPAFAYISFLPRNREETVRVSINTRYFDEIAAATSELRQCTQIVIVGNADANGRFGATEVRPFTGSIQA